MTIWFHKQTEQYKTFIILINEFRFPFIKSFQKIRQNADLASNSVPAAASKQSGCVYRRFGGNDSEYCFRLDVCGWDDCGWLIGLWSGSNGFPRDSNQFTKEILTEIHHPTDVPFCFIRKSGEWYSNYSQMSYQKQVRIFGNFALENVERIVYRLGSKERISIGSSRILWFKAVILWT